MKQNPEVHKETLAGVGCTYYLNYGDVSQVLAYIQTNQIVHIKYMWFFVYQYYLSKTIRNVNEKIH